jgi:hypothetical protein
MCNAREHELILPAFVFLNQFESKRISVQSTAYTLTSLLGLAISDMLMHNFGWSCTSGSKFLIKETTVSIADSFYFN